MGFPVGYSEFFFPMLILHILSILSFIRKLISSFFRYILLQDFSEPDTSNPNRMPEFQSVHALLIREIIPVVRFRELVDPPENCAVCLSEFGEDDEIRRLANCTHVFHRGCLDRWMGYDQRTCPLCRIPFISQDLEGAFNERLWATSGIPEFYSEYRGAAL